MMAKVDMERIDRSLRFLMDNDKPFGGKIILLSGDFRQILPVERNPIDGIDSCLKSSYLWNDGTIQQLYLTINERVRQFGGDESYATFLMYLGLGLLTNNGRSLDFSFRDSDDLVQFSTEIGGTNIVTDFKDVEDFVSHLFPNIGSSDEIPKTIILTPKNKNMYEINDMCLEKFKPNDKVIEVLSRDKPFIPEQESMFPEELLNQYNPGCLPQHKLRLKKHCSLMLLRYDSFFFFKL